MGKNPWKRETRGTKTLMHRDWILLERAAKAAGVPLRVVQGSWNNGSLSAGTHSGAGAADLSVHGMTEKQQLKFINEMRKRNGKAWIRSRKYGGWTRGDHIHVIIADTPGLSYGAGRQVINYKNKENGLANHGRDYHARPTPHITLIPGMVYLKHLQYGKKGKKSVRKLQRKLDIYVDGHYGPQTDKAVRAHQKKCGWKPDPVNKSYVGPAQAKKLGFTF